MKRAISKVGVGSIMIMIVIIIAVLIACGILTPEKQSGFWDNGEKVSKKCSSSFKDKGLG